MHCITLIFFKMKYLICLLSGFLLLSFSACELFFFSRPNVGELGRNIDTRTINDMKMIDSIAENIYIAENESFVKNNVDEFIRIVDYIPLETNENMIIGNIDKLILHNDIFYILDSNKAKSVFIFNKDGSYKGKISRFGQGRNEYRYLRDMELDTINNQLILYDRNDGKVLFFDLDGNFIKTHKVGLRFSNFKIFPNGDFFFYTSNNQNVHNSHISGFNALIGQLNGKMFYRCLKNCIFLENLKIVDGYKLNEHNGNISFSPRLSNTIYEVEVNGQMRKVYNIQFPSGQMENYVQLDPSYPNFLNEIANAGYYYSLGGNLLMNDSLLYFLYVNNEGQYNHLWYNRNSMDFHISKRFYSSSGRILSFSGRPLFSKNNQLIGVINASSAARSKSIFLEAHNKKNNGLSECLLSRIEAVTEYDNPILMIYEIKWN